MAQSDTYANQEAIVSTEWVAENLDSAGMRLVEVDVDTTAYDSGHIRGAVGWDWRRELQDQTVRDIASRAALEALLARSGVSPDTTVVLYGDNNNWFAAYAYWMLTYYGHPRLKLMNGGRVKWLAEGRELTTAVPGHDPAPYRFTDGTREDIRAYRDTVLGRVGHVGLVDVRSPKEYAGELLAPENLPQEGAQRGGHIPTAANIPWASAVREDGTFKPAGELLDLYGSRGIVPEREVIAYCRIGERSAHTWFVLRELLGYPAVRNYDGSWTEWGSAIRVPIER
ncbi:MAG TPA: sulfurtransferase [Terriglobales bacterium]|nr:sulfurtransferase [Terriglobales bacterium]